MFHIQVEIIRNVYYRDWYYIRTVS